MKEAVRMPEEVSRGFSPGDAREFGPESAELLNRARQDIVYLLDRGYNLEGSVTFVGNRFQFSARQRTALTRACAPTGETAARKARQISEISPGSTILIDGFNVIIPLEIAQCGNTLLLCMDGAVRDLAGLHGTYRLIDKTDGAILLIAQKLREIKVARAVFYLDSPVSNAGRLKTRMGQLLAGSEFQWEITLVPNADRCLMGQDFVATGDAYILDNCKSWVNLTREIMEDRFPGYPFVNLTGE